MGNKNGMILDVEEKPSRLRDWILLSLQHVLAMLVACITVPLLVPGLPISATLISAGLGTICYILITKFESPVFLSSSFAYILPMQSALAIALVGQATGNNYLALIIGMLFVGLVYVGVAVVVHFVGTDWLNKLLPPIIVGPVIMVIGLSLASSAVSNITKASGSNQSYNLVALLCGLIALFVTAFSSHYGKKMAALIPFVIGMGSGYLAALLFTCIGYYACGNETFHIIDFSALANIFSAENISFNSFFNYKLFVPNSDESFIFLRFDEIAKFDWTTLGQVALLFIPVSFVTICEHIGDHENLGNIIGRDLLNGKPGMQRTLTGDGVGTAISGVLCGAANTTYGENVAVVGMTKIASVPVIFLAAILTVLFGFLTPFTALLQTIPACVTGGVSLILYGFIASSGVKMLIKEKIDFSIPKNIYIASTILVAGIGGLAFKFGNPDNPTITITSIAVAMILGILLNVTLKTPKKGTPTAEEVIEEEEKAELKDEKAEVKAK